MIASIFKVNPYQEFYITINNYDFYKFKSQLMTEKYFTSLSQRIELLTQAAFIINVD